MDGKNWHLLANLQARKEEDSRSFTAQRKQHAKSYFQGKKQKDSAVARRIRRMKQAKNQ